VHYWDTDIRDLGQTKKSGQKDRAMTTVVDSVRALDVGAAGAEDDAVASAAARIGVV